MLAVARERLPQKEAAQSGSSPVPEIRGHKSKVLLTSKGAACI